VFPTPKDIQHEGGWKVISGTTMVRGNPQGSPIAARTAVVWEAERILKEKEGEERRKTHGMRLRAQGSEGHTAKSKFLPLSYIDDINSVRVGKVVIVQLLPTMMKGSELHMHPT